MKKRRMGGNKAAKIIICAFLLVIIFIEVTPPPIETPYPKPSYIPTMPPTDCQDKSNDIWHPCNPSSYIMPDNPWVKYYAAQLFIDTDGRIKYKGKKIISIVDERGNPLSYDYKAFTNNYDIGIYEEAYGWVDKNNVPWMMPDYYLTHEQRGVCSAWAVTVTSMMLSGEMSLWQGDKLVKQVIPAKVVLGYYNKEERHSWVEYQAYNKSWITGTSLETDTFLGIKKSYSYTYFIEKNNDFKPVFEFTDKYFRRI